MSNALAIAAVTATLSKVLSKTLEVPGFVLTTKPLDKARAERATGPQINLFLYHTVINETFRNMDMPRQVKSGETGHPPLGLRLYYLLTAYGDSEDDKSDHAVLGKAMSILHDHPILSSADIKTATETDLDESDLHEQFERVRITPEPLSVDDMFKLWSSFQTQYRPSSAYQISVVLIESAGPTKTPLPVLTRGEDDRGVVAQPDLAPPFPTLDEVRIPNHQPAAEVGGEDAITLTLRGHHLEADNVVIRLQHRRLEKEVELPVEPGATGTELAIRLPSNGSGEMAAGMWSLAAVLKQAGKPDRVTNELSLLIAPRIDSIEPNPADHSETGATITIAVTPEVRAKQRAALLLGDKFIAVESSSYPAGAFTIPIAKMDPGEYWLRLRVDGVDSLLVNRGVTPPVFKPEYKVTIT